MYLVIAVCFIKHVAKTLFSLKIVNVYIASLTKTNVYITESLMYTIVLVLSLIHIYEPTRPK